MEPTAGPSLAPKEQTSSKQEFLSQWDVNINFLSRGCVIRVGCKSIPFSSNDEAIAELNKYFSNPQETSREWRQKLI